MIKSKINIFLGLIVALISSCGQLNYGTPNFVATESADIGQLVDSLDASIDFTRLFNKVYQSEYTPLTSQMEDSIEYLDVVESEVDSSEFKLVSEVRSDVISEQKTPQTVIYAETVNIYQNCSGNDSIVVVNYGDPVLDSLGAIDRGDLKVLALETGLTTSLVDSVVPMSDSIATKTLSQEFPVKTDTVFNQVYITDTIRTLVPINPEISIPVVENVNRIDTVYSSQIDTVYLVDQTKQDSLYAVINKLKDTLAPPVRDTTYVVHINQDPIEPVKIDSLANNMSTTIPVVITADPVKVTDTVFVKEIETIYQTITDTVRIQEIKEVASEPIIVEKKPVIKEFIITFEKNTTKGDNFQVQSQNILAICSTSKDYLILLAGHTDKSGSESANIIMSQKRATSIRDQLITKGVDKTKIVTQWFGEEYATQENSASERVVKVRIEIRD